MLPFVIKVCYITKHGCHPSEKKEKKKKKFNDRCNKLLVYACASHLQSKPPNIIVSRKASTTSKKLICN